MKPISLLSTLGLTPVKAAAVQRAALLAQPIFNSPTDAVRIISGLNSVFA